MDKITSQSSSADILSYNFTLSSKKNNTEKVFDDENESPNKRLYSNRDDDINDIKSIKTSADVLTYNLNLSSKKKKVCNEDININETNINDNNNDDVNIVHNLDNDYYSNDNDNDNNTMNESNANISNTNDDSIPSRKELHHLLKVCIISINIYI